MGKISEEASVTSCRHSTVEDSASVASSRDGSVSVASSKLATSSVASSRQSQPTTEESSLTQSVAGSSKAASVTSSKHWSDRNFINPEVETKKSKLIKDEITRNNEIEDRPYQPKVNVKETKHRFKAQLRVDTGAESSPLSVHYSQPSPSPMYNAIEEETQPDKCSPCESAKSRNTAGSEASAFDPFGDDPFADHTFGGNNVFRGDNVPVVGFGDFIATSSSDTEHECAFLVPQQKDTKYKAQSQPTNNGVQKLTDVNRCAQFLPALDLSKNGFSCMESPTASSNSGKNKNKSVKKKQQQYSSAKPQKLTQKVFKNFGPSFDEASCTSGLGSTSNQDWRFQEALPQPPSIENSDTDDEEDEKPPLYEFSEGSCSLSPSDAHTNSSLGALVTHKKGFGLKIRTKMKQRIGSKKR